MQQWKDEIEKKSDADLTVCIHHGAGKKSGQSGSRRHPAFLLTTCNTARQLQRFDVVISSYNTVASEWVDPKPKRGKGKGKADAEGGGDDNGDDDDSGFGGAATSGALFEVENYYRSEWAVPAF